MNGVEIVAINNGCAKIDPLVNSCMLLLKKDLVFVGTSYFADGESNIYLKDAEKLKNKKVLFVAQFSFASGSSINSQLMNLLFSINILKQAGAREIIVFSPYLPYARQEESSVSQGLGLLGCVVNMFKVAGADRLISCDLHEPSTLPDLSLKIDEIRLESFWVNFILNNPDFDKCNKDIVIASPDKGGFDRAKKIASLLNLDFVCVQKERVGADLTVAKELNGDVKNKIVILVDDIIDTGGTAINACELFIANGASDVFGCFSHGVLSSSAISEIEKSSFKKIFVTDSVLLNDRELGDKIVEVSIDEFVCNRFLKYLEK